METQKYRINRDLTGTTWTIPCSGTTDVWPMNTSTNCSGTTVKNSTCKDIFNYVNGDTNDFPEDLKECSPAIPCIILWDCVLPSTYTIPLTTNIKCSNLEGYNYVKFSGLRVTYSVPIQDNFIEIKKVMSIARNNNVTLVPTVTKTDCDCVNPLNDISHKIQIYLSQDFNDIGHYDLWDGNMSQRDLFANFTISGDSSGYNITLTNTMNYSYYDELAPFTYTIDWGDGLTDTLPSTQASITHPYSCPPPCQRRVKLIQDSPWGPITSSKLLTLPLNSYPQMVGQAYVAGDVNNPGTGIGPNQINVSGMAGGMAAGSSAYHGRYPDFPLDSATNIEQFSGMSFTGLDCYVVTGVTESVLGNFQSYTNNSDPNLLPGYLLNIWVPIGGDVIHPLNNTFQTGMYGVITTATTTYTAYTVSSSFGATINNSDGDTPITFYDFSNGITIFEADSCGLDKRAFGALACIECPEDDCEWCEKKDEYYDRVDEVNYPLPTINNRQTWIPHPVVDYAFGDLVYDETYNSCCCFIAVKNITASDPWMYGKPPSTSNEGKFLDSGGTEVHVWEACSYDCISCGLGTQTPCNDITAPGWTGQVYGNPITSFSLGDYVEDQHGNCYEAIANPSTAPPTASTAHWDYIGCVSWICPTDPAATDCIMINGPQLGGVYGEMVYEDCVDNLNAPNGCFPPKYACPQLYDCVGCIPIDATHPLYTTSSAFLIASDCVQYCNPIAWSCETPTSPSCCFEISCNDTQPLYLSTVGANFAPTTTPASNAALISFKNTYDIYLEGGTPPAQYNEQSCIEGCCVTTSWSWSCGEQACDLIGGYPNGVNTFSTSAQCETHTLTLSQYSGQNATNLEDIICGWTCLPQNIDCVYQPCEPCYFDNCGFTEVACNTICSANTQCGCWHCDCEGGYSVDGGDCYFFLPCDGETGNPGVTGQTWVSWVDGYIGIVPGPNPAYSTYENETECFESCPCDVGWDCFNNSTGGTIGSCINPGSVQVMDVLGYVFSDSTPGFTGYTSFEECCENTGCCHGECIETHPNGDPYELDVYEQVFYNTLGGILGTSTPNSPYGLTTTYPCVYSPYTFPMPPPMPQPTCNDPAAFGFVYLSYLPWCTIDLCVQYNLTMDNSIPPQQICTEPPGDCDCACGDHIDFSASTGGWNGSYQNGPYGYHTGDAVSWGDADTDYCCFICLCPFLGTDWAISANITAAIGDPSMQDCNLHEPDLDPSTQGLGAVTNCWESCLLSPQSDPLDPDSCDPCDSGPGGYYECTDSGCTPSNCNDASLAFCYTTSNCDDMCDASCFCNGWMNATCTDSCITAELVATNPFLFNMVNTCGPFSYTQGTMDNCTTNLSSGVLDCCGEEQWYCDGSVGCSQMNLLPTSVNIGNGIGCVRVYPTDTTYYESGGIVNNYATQVECQEDCRWTCDPNGTQTCTFVLGAPLMGSYPSAFMCYISTIDCSCASASTEWWCYDDQDPLSLGGGCISNTSWLNYSQSANVYGQGQTQMIFGASPFTSQSECETHCRFCCDETGSNGGYCAHVWDGIGCCANDVYSPSTCSWPTELDCYLNQSQYPCQIGGGEYYCDLTQGCTQFPNNIAPGSGPNGTGLLGDGYANLVDCESNCAFDCGTECECDVTLTPDYTGTNPMNVYGAPWPTLVNCINDTSVGDLCCGCVGCADNATIWITHYNMNTSLWETSGLTANNLSNPVPQWVSGTYLPTSQQGDTVMHNGCCFIVTNSHSSGLSTITPTQDYNNYLNNLASTNPLDWPTLLNNFSNVIIYFPCDPGCVLVTGSTGNWYCDANITTNIPNCVQDTGVWTAPYSNNVFGLGEVSHTNNSNNGFNNQLECELKCRFCCVEVQGCQQCCQHNISSYYVVTTPPCKCNLGDVAVAWSKCKGGPKLPPDNSQMRVMESDTYLETYNNKMGNPMMTSKSASGPTPCVQTVSCDPATHVWEGSIAPGGGLGCCCCKPISTSAIWECELVWGDTDCLTTMYSCETLTSPCGDPDPCQCIGTTINWNMDPHTGTTAPYGIVTHIPGYYMGAWYPNMPIPPSIWDDTSYTIDPIDSCCYSYSHHNGSGPGTPYGPIPPSECYNNHLLGLYCDGSIHQWGVPNPFDGIQDDYPVWWPCDETCPTSGPSSWYCTINGCINQVGTNGYPDAASCIADCNEYQCDSDNTFAGISKCNTAFAMVSYVDGGGTTILINSPETFVNAFFNNHTVTFSDGSSGVPSGGPGSYSYYNTQPPLFAGQFLGCPDPSGGGGYQASTDAGFCRVAWGGNFTTIYATDYANLVSTLFGDGIDVSGCVDFACMQVIVLDPNHALNNSTVGNFTMFEPDYRPCQCQTSSVDCSCYLVIGTGHTDGYENTVPGYNTCLDDCCEGLCLDCYLTLAPTYVSNGTNLTHRGLSSYWGGMIGSGVRTYSINECVTDPTNDCCVCCVDNQLGNTVADVHYGFPADCHLDVTLIGTITDSISLYDGTGSGTGMWVWCGVAEDNTSLGSDGQACPTGPA